jgi:group I intron endonuclease
MKTTITGIYKITNTINNKMYIGSSYDIAHRCKRHLQCFNNNTHKNKHLLAAVNKYGITSFTFSILEKCSKEQLFLREQHHIDSFQWNQLYNKATIAGGGGGETTSIPLYLLSMKGEIVKEFKNGLEVCAYFNTKVDYSKKNTKRITMKQYRLVTPEFYTNHLDVVLSWKPYSNETLYKLSLPKKITTYIVYNETETYVFNTLTDVGLMLNVTNERVRQIIMSKAPHKSTQYFIRKEIN